MDIISDSTASSLCLLTNYRRLFLISNRHIHFRIYGRPSGIVQMSKFVTFGSKFKLPASVRLLKNEVGGGARGGTGGASDKQRIDENLSCCRTLPLRITILF